jgi:hypothetical protein
MFVFTNKREQKVLEEVCCGIERYEKWGFQARKNP